MPINVIDKHLEKIEKLGYSYIVYNLDKEKAELKIVKEYKGKPNKVKRKDINCLLCKGVSKYPDDNYLEALRKLYEQQLQQK